MHYRQLGKSGLKVSLISFGSYLTLGHQVNFAKATRLMEMAYDAGINFFDNAEVYALGEAEKIMGQALGDLNWSRDTYIICTKVFWGGDKPTQQGLNRKHIFEACSASLKRLKLDYLDIYLCHRPDKDTPIEETVWTMNQLIQQGKVLYWGTSEWSAQQIMEAYAVAREHHLIPPILEQFQYNMFERANAEQKLINLFTNIGIGATITMSLAGGILTGKYNDHIPTASRANLVPYFHDFLVSQEGQDVIRKTKQLKILSEELGVTLAQLAISWCLKNQNISSVILGVTNEEQLKDNLEALNVVNLLDLSVLKKIELILKNQPTIDQYPAYSDIIKTV
jgi:voltage-dependent potassium channel beta subunit